MSHTTVKAGTTESRSAVEVMDGGRSPAKDIFDAAEENVIGTVTLGRKDDSTAEAYAMGQQHPKSFE